MLMRMEWRSVWQRLAFSHLIWLLFPALLWAAQSLDALAYVRALPGIVAQWIGLYQVVWVAGNLGHNAFARERRERAIEYWLALPYTMGEKLLAKLVPRLVVVLLVCVEWHFVTLLSEWHHQPRALYPWGLVLALGVGILLFFMALSPLPAINRQAILLVFSGYGMVFLAFLLYGWLSEGAWTPHMARALAAVLALWIFVLAALAAATAFWRRFDGRGLNCFQKRFRWTYLWVLLVLLVVLFLTSRLWG